MPVSRRKFLGQAGAIGCSTAASPFITPVVFASAPTDTRLVVIILRGAMDGLDVVQPYGDPNLSAWRNSLSVGPEAGAHDLDGFYALHPKLAGLMPLWAAGELGFVHAVSTPYRNKRSHFDGQDFLENGGASSDGALTEREDGWLNRLLPLMGGVSEQTAFSVGRERLRLVSGDAPHSSWSPDAGMELSAQGQLLLEEIYRNDPLFHDGRISGRWPGLSEADLFERRDLMPTDDVRRHAAHVMRGLFGVSGTDIARSVFPGLDMGDDPGLLL